MVHPAALAISLGVVLGGAIFALFYHNTRFNQNRYEERPRRSPFDYMQQHFETDVCSICLDRFDDSDDDDMLLECAHRFHVRCIEESLRHNNLCPNCRRVAKKRQA